MAKEETSVEDKIIMRKYYSLKKRSEKLKIKPPELSDIKKLFYESLEANKAR